MVHWRREWQSIQYSGLENPIKYENAKDRTMNDKLIRSVGAQHATRDHGEITPERIRDGTKAKITPRCGCDW